MYRKYCSKCGDTSFIFRKEANLYDLLPITLFGYYIFYKCKCQGTWGCNSKASKYGIFIKPKDFITYHIDDNIGVV